MLVAAVSQIAKRGLRRCVSAAARELAVLAAVGFFAAVAAVGGLVAAYQALLTVWAPYWAAAAIAAAALAVVLLTLAVRALRAPRRRPAATGGAADFESLAAALRGDTSAFARSALDEAEARYRQDPAAALAAAAALGFVSGLVWPDEAE